MWTRRKKVRVRVFRCPVCGEKSYAPKRTITRPGHVKTMWCWKCRAERDLVQVDEI